VGGRLADRVRGGLWHVVAVLLVASSSLQAHGDLHEQIAAVTQRIAEHPRDAALYFRRAELHRQHEAWDSAWADLETAGRLDAALADLERLRGQVLLESGRPAEARPHLDRQLQRNPEDGLAYLFRARALFACGLAKEAARDYTRALARLERPQPQHYLERAQAQRQAGPVYYADAIRGLDEGLARLGTNVSLELAAGDIEIELKQYDAALARVDRIAAQAARKGPWLFRRGEILERARRPDEARAAYAQALAAIEALPRARRHVRMTNELEVRVRAALARLGESADASAGGKGATACSEG